MSITAVRGSGLLASLRRLVGTVTEILHTRLELFVTELDEERARIVRALVLAAIGAYCLAMGVLLLAIFIIVAYWDEHRLLAIGLLTGAFSVAGIAALIALRTLMGKRRQMFAQTLAELRADRDKLSR